MIDKKIVSLQAVPKQAKPVEEEKKYKVSDQVLEALDSLVKKAHEEHSYIISEDALVALMNGMVFVIEGAAHDAVSFVHHKSSYDISGTSTYSGVCPDTNKNPFKFLTLFRHAARGLEDEFVYPPPEEFYE